MYINKKDKTLYTYMTQSGIALLHLFVVVNTNAYTFFPTDAPAHLVISYFRS